MEIYLDANATTPTLPEARAAAMAAMSENFGNPSSTHSAGLRARLVVEDARKFARRALEIDEGMLVFVSGATEGIQTAILSALTALQARMRDGEPVPSSILVGATEHKAVPQAVEHWLRVLNLNLQVLEIPVNQEGQHDLTWLGRHASTAGLVCTMAANNETGSISDLDGIAEVLSGWSGYWLVDGVQALGKIQIALSRRPIDYATFSGHKLYAPKGVGMLYVRQGAPYTPLIVGGGQEYDQRSGTENLSGIAGLGAVLRALCEYGQFESLTTLSEFKSKLILALREAFPGVVLNSPDNACLPTTINFSVPNVNSRVLLDLFDAAGVRVSAGSACSSSKAQPSHVLVAMGLPDWQTESAVRISFGPIVDAKFIDQACSRILDCGKALLASRSFQQQPTTHLPSARVLRFAEAGTCCYVIQGASTNECIVIDPFPDVMNQVVQHLRLTCSFPVAVLSTGDHGFEHVFVDQWRQSEAQGGTAEPIVGWPAGKEGINIGAGRFEILPYQGSQVHEAGYLLLNSKGGIFFGGDRVDISASDPVANLGESSLLSRLGSIFRDKEREELLILPRRDPEDLYAAVHHPIGEADIDRVEKLRASAGSGDAVQRKREESASTPCSAKEIESLTTYALGPEELKKVLSLSGSCRLVDVRESYEQYFGEIPGLGVNAEYIAVPLAQLVGVLPELLRLGRDCSVVFFCRSGNRSAVAARVLRRLGVKNAWSLAGGMALWRGEFESHRALF